MKLYTTQISQWRKVKPLGVEFYNVTVKSGDRLFAPSWNLLRDYKQGVITEDQYTERFLEEMRGSFKHNKQH